MLDDDAEEASAEAVRVSKPPTHCTDPDQWLPWLRQEYPVIGNVGGKCLLVHEVWNDALERHRLTYVSFADFRNAHLGIEVEDGTFYQRGSNKGLPKRTKLGKWYLEHPQRRTFEQLVFLPERHIPGCYNMWRGFGVAPAEGNKHQLFLDHLRDNVCNGNATHFAYLLGWMARAVQKPAEQGHVALVLRGGKGVGKGVVAKHFGRLFGRHYLQVSNPNHVVGNFNGHLRDVVVLFADEAFFAGDRKHESVLKTLVTEATLTIEQKGIDAVAAPNFVHLIMASNEGWVVPASGDERRYFVLDVGTGQQQNGDYFAAIEHQLEAGGYETLLHFLKNYDLSTFKVRDVPKTEALRDQQEHSLSKLGSALRDILTSGEWPVDERAPHDELARQRARHAQGIVRAEELLFAIRRFHPYAPVNQHQIGKLLGKLGFLDCRRGTKTVRVAPPLAEARELFRKHVAPLPFPEDGEWLNLHTAEGPF